MWRKSWTTWVLFAGLLWLFPVSPDEKLPKWYDLKTCVQNTKQVFFVPDNFNGLISAVTPPTKWGNICIVFLKKDESLNRELDKYWPQMRKNNGYDLLYISRWHTKQTLVVYVLQGRQCNGTKLNSSDSECVFSHNAEGPCQIRCFQTEIICKDSVYDERYCSKHEVKNRYIINITSTQSQCRNCNNPVKKPEKTITLNTTWPDQGGTLDPSKAAELMNGLAEFASSITEPEAAISGGEGVSGILVKRKDPTNLEEVSFAYESPNESLSIIQNRNNLAQFSRSVTVSKEAFEKSVNSNISETFVAVFRFLNMGQDDSHSTVLGNEVLGVEMGTQIANLTEKININFFNMKYNEIPSCHSWNGEGDRPNWTDDGCQTLTNGGNITCKCSHLTFFAILLSPLNETTSSSDLKNLTVITQVGCGLSMFFLSIVFFMHFLLRRTKATIATKILINLVSAMFLLNFTFLINNFVAKLNSLVGCKIMAALMHYFMLVTFTWFAAQAFHLCLQMYTGGNIDIRHYVLKVSITSWVIPTVFAIILLSTGKYGEQVIHTDNTADNVAMCWITDNDVHYVVNIGYYVLVFLFTFSSFIIILSWLFCHRRSEAGNVQVNKNRKSIVTILGLCSMLGITWGFAFFAHGALRIPSNYIFTVLNSFQGFFLFIYYYNTRHLREINAGKNGNKSSDSTTNTSTLKTHLDILKNPYTH